MKKIALALLLLSCLTSAAHASLYDDREKQEEERANQAKVQQMVASYAKIQRKSMRAISLFGRAHSGYASQPECFDFSYSASNWRMSSRQACDQGVCVTIHGEGMGYLNGHENNPIYVDVANRDAIISSCKVVLKNGLACHIDENFENSTYGGECIDGNGHSRVVSVPFKW
jgi:hypothetical protein